MLCERERCGGAADTSPVRGVAPSTIYSMLNQKSKNPGVVSLQKICDGLEISLRTFFDDPVFEALEPIIQ